MQKDWKRDYYKRQIHKIINYLIFLIEWIKDQWSDYLRPN